MDNPVPTARFAPDRRLAAFAGAAAAGFAGVTVFLIDAPGRILTGLAACLLACVAVDGLLGVARLTVSASGLDVRSLTRRRFLAWPQIDSLAVEERSRLGLAGRALEIDAGEDLILLSGRALGADPRDVLAVLEAFRPPA